MNPLIKIIGVIILILAVTVYTVINYLSANIDFRFFLVSMG